ncbi:tetraspanin-10 isoform X2 [Pyxicephalus adspersus]|uniref:Tetraspanin-10 n=1 Tax=Pyxicephalus adspersus TaxID=30357 RepID=A0AAV3AKH7_PYXAD|nr:TPA: hypothetical protein GDO54_008072 [Pyxicephalus adspersus]
MKMQMSMASNILTEERPFDGHSGSGVHDTSNVTYYTRDRSDVSENISNTLSDTPKKRFLVIPYYPDPFLPIIKYFMFFINVLFFTAGLSTMSFSIWGLCFKESLAGGRIEYLDTDPMLFFLLVGLITCTLSLSACIGFIRENTILLRIFFYGLFTVIIAQGLIAICILDFQQQIQDLLKNTMFNAMTRYQDDLDLKFIVDEVQLGMKCCGVESFQDWEVNMYYNCTSPGIPACGVPYSCCIDPLQNGSVPNSQCGFGALRMGDLEASNIVYIDGCLIKLNQWFSYRIWDIVASYFLLIAIEITFVALARRVIEEVKVLKYLH